MDISNHYHMEDVGKILLQAQQDLKLLRERIQPITDTNNNNTKELENIIYQAELNLHKKAEIVLNGIVNGSMRTLPSIGITGENENKTISSSILLNEKKTKHMKRNVELVHKPNEILDNNLNNKNIQAITKKYGIDLHSPLPQKKIKNQMNGSIKKNRITKPKNILPTVNRIDPRSEIPEINSNDVKDGLFNLQNRGLIPTGTDLSPALTSGNTIFYNKPLRIYERKDLSIQQMSMPYVNPTGFNIASLKLDVETVVKSAKHSIELNHNKNSQQKVATKVFNFPINKKEDMKNELSNQYVKYNSIEQNNSMISPDKRKEKNDQLDTYNNLRDNIEKIREYNELLDTYSLHQFIIRKGRTLRETPEFISFERKNQENWGAIESVIHQLEKLFSKYNIPLVYVDGQQLIKLASDDLTYNLKKKDLMTCIINTSQIQSIMNEEGLHYLNNCNNRNDIAATIIQSNYRMHQCFKKYIKKKNSNEAALIIQNKWKIYKSYKTLRIRLKDKREENINHWNVLMKSFISDWNNIKMQKRVVVHLPSFSINDKEIRINIENFKTKENMQMSRLCGIGDPYVDIIYISPFDINTEIKNYYMKLLALKEGIDDDYFERIRILYPENINRFPDHFSLSTILLYSPRCLKKIKRYIRGKKAYLVTGVPGQEDKRVAIVLEIPILGIDPDNVQIFSSKSGSKRLFMAADVNIPIGSYDIYDQDELMNCLEKLIHSNIYIDRWHIRLDEDNLYHGFAYIDVIHLVQVREWRSKMEQLQNNSVERYWEMEGFTEILDDLKRKLHEELFNQLPKLIKICCSDIYNTWEQFLAQINRIGCVIEAGPTNVKGYIRSNIFIEPTGNIHLTSAQDHLITSMNEHLLLGSSFPQKKVPHRALLGATNAIGKKLVEYGGFGYFSIDFTCFIDNNNNKNGLKLWAMDIFPYFTNSAMTYVTFNFLLNGQYVSSTGEYHLRRKANLMNKENETSGCLPKDPSLVSNLIQIDSNQSYNMLIAQETSILKSRQNANTSNEDFDMRLLGEKRYFITQEYIYHPNLSTARYSAFFNACRMDGVCFDLQSLTGTTFLPYDSLTSGVIGIIATGKNTKEAVQHLGSALQLVINQVGTRVIPNVLDGGRVCGNFGEVLSTIRKLEEPKTSKYKNNKTNNKNSGYRQ